MCAVLHRPNGTTVLHRPNGTVLLGGNHAGRSSCSLSSSFCRYFSSLSRFSCKNKIIIKKKNNNIKKCKHEE